LAHSGLLPGCTVTIVAADRQGMTIRTPAIEQVLPIGLVQQVWVTPVVRRS
jgi:hypothetical protein